MIGTTLDKYLIKQPYLRRNITSLVYGNKDRTVHLLGSRFTVNSLRENGYLRAAKKVVGSSLLEDEVSTLITLPMAMGQANVFVDIGANIGIFSCMMARKQLFDNNFRVLAFEPHPDTFARLKRNAEPLGVEVHNVGLGEQETIVEFVEGAVSHVFTRSENANAYNIVSERLRVPIKRLDSFDLYSCKLFIKIDVEGQEFAVLKGASALLDNGAITGVYLDGFDDKRVLGLLRQYNFKFYDLRSHKPCDGDAFALLAIRNDINPA